MKPGNRMQVCDCRLLIDQFASEQREILTNLFPLSGDCEYNFEMHDEDDEWTDRVRYANCTGA